MKIAVVAANGKAGKLIVQEAVNRGFDVTAIVRGENKTVASSTINKNLFELTREDIAGFDAVVNAYGDWTPEALELIPAATAHLAKELSGTKTRLLVVGGAGSLYVNPEHTKTVLDVTNFPEELLPVVKGHANALAILRKVEDTQWTYISPAGDFQPEGKRTGIYIIGGDELVLNSKGESVISYADYAVAVVDEIESGNHINERISVVSE